MFKSYYLLKDILKDTYTLYRLGVQGTKSSSEYLLSLNLFSINNLQTVLSLFFTRLIWLKARVGYIANNWIYTTNHKRIAFNYFGFVLFSGIVGTVLATIIRTEMAYPGIGILAGDSLQYLSVVTAHAVVMVFFMIMPLIFGAFANFLLPTQLGVHDVAFPRLNSAAFWFLPAGFIMLCQIVCADRRYQRMNCFNIREMEALLKSKYFTNLIDVFDHHWFLESTALGVRFKTNNVHMINHDLLIMFNHGLVKSPITRHQTYNITSDTSSSSLNFLTTIWNNMKLGFLENTKTITQTVVQFFTESFTSGIDYSIPSYPVFYPNSIFQQQIIWVDEQLPYKSKVNSIYPTYHLFGYLDYYATRQVSKLLEFYHNVFGSEVRTEALKITSFIKTFNDAIELLVIKPLNSAKQVLWHQLMSLWNFISIPFILYAIVEKLTHIITHWDVVIRKNLFTNYNVIDGSSQLNTTLGVKDYVLYSYEDINASYRLHAGLYPTLNYDYKSGNYWPSAIKQITSSSFFTTWADIGGATARNAGFRSLTFRKYLLLNFTNYQQSIVPIQNDGTFATSTNISGVNTMSTSTVGFYNFFSTWMNSPLLLNSRWVSVNTMDQKFYRMFETSSTQQRIFNNWRQLKFTREAWRCKLLAARHQNTLYRRWAQEERYVWLVDRNAKDVLPGWAMITPFSARTRYTAIGKVDLGLMGVFLVLNSSIVSSANFLVTYRYLSTLNNRKMRDARSFFTEGVMVASWMMIAANPMLAIGILMLLCDRHWQTSFFDYSGGGDTVLFQHMFWFFGHPEVYVIMIPAFGFNNTLLSFYLRKRVSARASLMYSMYTIAFLGFFVWGHHMYMVGLAHTTRMLFSTLTVMISVPAATKLMHWCVTLVNSSFWVELPLIFTLLFIFFFVSGGISGMAVANTGMDILFHDSFYVIGHFHVMFAGAAMFASFGACYFYFPSIVGVKFSRIWAYLHLIYFTLGQLMTVIPMFWLGYSGMPRRVLDYPASLGGWHGIVSGGHLITVAGLMAFFFMIFDSMRQGRAALRTSFGVSRFNTRVNFYTYEVARNLHINRRGWYNYRYPLTTAQNNTNLNSINFELLELSHVSYVFIQKTK